MTGRYRFQLPLAPNSGNVVENLINKPFTVNAINKEQGRYQFTHNFEYGSNFVIIKVEEYGLEKNKYEEQFVFTQCPDCINIGGGGDDPIGGGGDDGGFKIDIGLLIAGAIVFVGIAIFVAIIFRRKKN